MQEHNNFSREMFGIISQAVIIKDKKVLMVRQYVQRGDIVWNFPGGGIEENETPEEACIREVKEETGLEVTDLILIHLQDEKYTYLIKNIKGSVILDTTNRDNEDILEVRWISLDDSDKFDTYTKPIMDMLSKIEAGPNLT
ncbi:NUDIX hydrolase [Paenibacillus septentrionalis]|uniref:NUDIX hydrolase n=1 Tax=Paenibacillus septentrionalis TaxID=429342 RepID=A0ABW1V2T9_9BACL